MKIYGNVAKSTNILISRKQLLNCKFLRRIQKEKKQLDTKYKYIQSLDTQALMDEASGEQGSGEFI